MSIADTAEYQLGILAGVLSRLAKEALSNEDDQYAAALDDVAREMGLKTTKEYSL